MVSSKTSASTHIITLRPNRSATWQETRIVILFLCSSTLAVGIFWAFVGAWVILPFSGLEAGLIAWLMYKVSLSTYQRQIITIDENRVAVQSGIYYPRKSWQLNREHTRIEVVEPLHHLSAPSLSLSDSENHVRIGHFLNKEDVSETLTTLKAAGLFVRYRQSD